MARWLLRGSIAASVLLILAHFAYTFTAFHALTLQSVQFAELGLPLLFAAFLNGTTWSTPAAGRLARGATHMANALMLVVGVLVVRFAPLPPAYLVVACAAGLAVAAVLCDIGVRAGDAVPAAPRIA